MTGPAAAVTAAREPSGSIGLVLQCREPSAPVALARILVGWAALLIAMSTGGRLHALRTPGVFRAPYSFSPPVDAAWVGLLPWLMAGLAVAAILGWRTRAAMTGLTLTIAAVLALDQQLYSNHVYLLALECGLLCFADSGAALSLDARRSGGRDWVEGWPILLLKIQLTIVYGFSAAAKINPSFLAGYLLRAGLRTLGLPVQIAVVLAYATVAAELFLALALWFPATRRPAMLMGLLMHSFFLVAILRGPALLAFELEMLALYVLFAVASPGAMRVVYDPRSAFLRTWAKRCERLDWLGACRFSGQEQGGLQVFLGQRQISGFRAVREIANVLPATYFVSAALYLPGLAGLGERVFQSLIRRGDGPRTGILASSDDMHPLTNVTGTGDDGRKRL
jgi:hypothetical protein